MALLSLTSMTLSVIIIMNSIFYSSSKNYPMHAKNSVKLSFFVSLMPLFFYISNSTSDTSTNFTWFKLNILNMSLTMQLDLYAIIFLSVAFAVTWSILEFSMWYMQDDPKINQFFKYLMIFLLAMIILVSSGNLFFLFVGWEGVGIMSFLLIGWYHARADAATAALQAVIYNRAGDMGFLLAFCWLIMNAQSLDLPHILSSSPSPLLLLGLIMAAASKSALFGFHPWLASAMEGPTPVSALLHSSTMVVAGIFLLIRIHPLISPNQMALTMCLCLGALSTFYAATHALIQNDVKKIIAYSTSSQLGLMMVSIGLNLPYLAFFHICTHAFSKAMLFLCSGLIIHSLNNEQDIRKMGGLQHALPVTTTCLSIGSFALMGIPFLAGFYSKDAIIEAVSLSYVNSTALLLTLIATAFTAVYSMRLIFFISFMQPRTNPVLLCDENDVRVLNPLTRLAIGSILAGLLIFKMITPDYPLILTMPIHVKMTALLVTSIAFIIAFDLAHTFWTTTPKTHGSNKDIDTSLPFHRTITIVTMNMAWQLISHVLESIMLKKIGPSSVEHLQMFPINVVRNTQTARIKTYLSILFITLFFALAIFKIAG